MTTLKPTVARSPPEMMKYFIGILLLSALSVSISTNADDADQNHTGRYIDLGIAPLGQWNDKTYPNEFQYEFALKADFIYTRTIKDSGKVFVSKGVWELGSWIIAKASGTKRSCRLMVYANTNQCCFEYEFIADNLILTNEYTKEYSTDEFSGMCESRVLMPATKK